MLVKPWKAVIMHNKNREFCRASTLVREKWGGLKERLLGP